MNYKKIYLPLRPHIAKFVKQEFAFQNGHLFLSSKRLLRPADITPKNYQDYFVRIAYEEEMVMIPCMTIDSRLYKLYAFIQYLDDRFAEKMCDYIYTKVLAAPDQHEAKPALREFLALYDIYESEYGADTGYRRWQRSNQYQLLKANLQKLKEYECN